MRWRPSSLLWWIGGLLSVLVLSVEGRGAIAPAGADVVLPEKLFPALADILASSAHQSPKILARNAENAIAEGNRIMARAPQLPGASASFNYVPIDRQYRHGSTNETQNVQRISYNVGITQPVYYWGALRDGTRIGKLGEEIVKGQSAEAYRTMLEEIRGAYLQLIVKKRVLIRTRFAQQLAERRLAVVKVQVQQHTLAPSEEWGATMAADQATLATDRAEVEFAQARRFFGKLTGSEAPTEAQLPDSIPAVTPAPEALQGIFAKFTAQSEPDSYSLQILRDQIAIEKLNYSINATRLRPKVNWVLALTQDQQSYSVDPGNRYQVRDTYTGLQINWSLFDGFTTRELKGNSLIRRRQLEQSYNDQKADTLENVRSQYRQLGFAARSLDMAEKYYGVSVNGINVQRDNLARGLISQTDFDNMQLSQYDSEIGIYSARADYLMKIADFLSTTLSDPALANLPSDFRR